MNKKGPSPSPTPTANQGKPTTAASNKTPAQTEPAKTPVVPAKGAPVPQIPPIQTTQQPKPTTTTTTPTNAGGAKGPAPAATTGNKPVSGNTTPTGANAGKTSAMSMMGATATSNVGGGAKDPKQTTVTSQLGKAGTNPAAKDGSQPPATGAQSSRLPGKGGIVPPNDPKKPGQATPAAAQKPGDKTPPAKVDPKAGFQKDAKGNIMKDAKGNPIPIKAPPTAPGQQPPPVSPKKEVSDPTQSPSGKRIPEKLQSTIQGLNMETDTLVIILTEQLTVLRQKLIQAESDIIENKSKGNTKEGLNSKLQRDVKQLTEQNTALMKEIQEITQKKDKLEHQFSRLDQIQREFEQAIKKIEQQEDTIKLRNEQIEEAKKQIKHDSKANTANINKFNSAMQILQQAEQRLTSLVNNQCTKIKTEIGLRFDKAIITKEFEVLNNSLKQVLESANTKKVDPNGPSPDSFQKQLFDSNQKVQQLEADLKEVRGEYREFRIDNENNKRENQRLNEENLKLKEEVKKYTQTNQKLFSDYMDTKTQQQQSQQETHDIINKLQIDFEDVSLQFQKASNAEKQYKTQLKDCKTVLKMLKNKIIEVEGVVRDFKMFEKQFHIDTHKHFTQMANKDKEIVVLKQKITDLEDQNENLQLRLLKFQKKDNSTSLTLPSVLDKNSHTPVVKSVQQAEKKGKGKAGESADPIQEEIKHLKSTIIKQDEEIYLLKDMVKSTALQIRVKEGELKRVKRNMDTSSSMPGSPGGKHRRGNNSTLLPSLKNNESDYGQDANTMRENAKLDKLTELSSKFKSVQMKGKFIDRGIQTGGGGLKHAQTQCTSEIKKVEMGIQSELSKGLDKQGQTDFGSYSDVTARISKIEIVLRKKKKKKKPKAEGKAPTVDDNGVIKEEEAEESYYEYYEEEVDEEEPGANGEQPKPPGVAGYQPQYTTAQKKP